VVERSSDLGFFFGALSPSIPAVSPPIVAPMWPHIGLAQGSILVRLRLEKIGE
jgi:hypothetical protein